MVSTGENSGFMCGDMNTAYLKVGDDVARRELVAARSNGRGWKLVWVWFRERKKTNDFYFNFDRN